MNPGDCDDDGAAGILMPIPSFHRRGQYQYFPKFQNTSSFFVPPWFDEWSEALLAFPFMRLLGITIVTVLEDNGVVIKKNPLAFWFYKTLFSSSVYTKRLLQRLIKRGIRNTFISSSWSLYENTFLSRPMITIYSLAYTCIICITYKAYKCPKRHILG